MLREQARRLDLINTLVDSLASVLSFGVAWSIRSLEPVRELFGLGPSPLTSDVLASAAVVAVVWPLVLRSCGAYESHRRQTFFELARTLAQATVIGVVILLGAAFALHLQGLSRAIVGLFAIINFAVLLGGRVVAFATLHAIRRRGYNFRTAVVLGTGARARRVAARIEASPEWGIRILGFADDEPSPHDKVLVGDRYLGPLKNLVDLLRDEIVDEVLFALPRRYLGHESTSNAIALCDVYGIDFTIVNDLFDTRAAKPLFHDFLGVPCITLAHPQNVGSWQVGVKRFIDMMGSALVLIVSAPIWISAAIAIKLESRGPVLFVQKRSGLNGRAFSCLKFRTMYENAEQARAELEELNEVSGPVFKVENDPRVTRVGRFLRKYSIDELPQLLNVLIGQMSLVGPRPPIPTEVDQYEPDQRRRLSVRPGLTGLWQVSGRNRIPFEDWVKLDLQYIDEWSLLLDAQILVATIPAVFQARGAS